MNNAYQTILLALAQGQVNFIVAGGVAAVLHGVERVTMDIDISLEMSDKNITNFLKVINSLSLKPRVPVAPDFIASKANRELLVKEKNAVVFTYNHPTNPLFHLDIFMTQALSYEELIKDTVVIELEEEKIKIVSIKKLLELKKLVKIERPKDIHDIMVLTKILEETDDR